jgi:hypothetical protein
MKLFSDSKKKSEPEVAHKAKKGAAVDNHYLP